MWCLSDKDDYGRAVSTSDDFYNTSYTAFWLIEGFLLSLFLSYARLFDFYDPFLETDEIESSFQNEDCENESIIALLTSFTACFFLGVAVDLLLVWESSNVFFLVNFFILLLLSVLYRFFIMSARFVEEMDIEEDGEDVFDDQDTLFEHEDFPDEATDGGDYAEGYETLQLFFGYWHYLFIVLHLLYIIYTCFASSAKQSVLYWAVVAVVQNLVLGLCLEYLDWTEVFFTIEMEWTESMYPFLFISEVPTSSIKSFVSDLTQLLSFSYHFAVGILADSDYVLYEFDDFYSETYLFIRVLCLWLLFPVWRL